MTSRVLSLPVPSGDYYVGYTDIVSKYGKDRILMRLFYPTSDSFVEEEAPLWVSEKQYMNGFADLGSMRHLTWAIRYRMAFAQMPFVLNGKLKLPNGMKKMPIMIFSHDWGVNRLVYSTLASELASNGVLVAIIEHADHSASSTYYLEEVEIEDGVKTAKKRWVEFIYSELGSDGDSDLRKTQLSVRTDDCISVLSHLAELNEGTFRCVNPCVDLCMFEGVLDLSQVTVAGHGFGGATALAAVSQHSMFKAAVVMDVFTEKLEDVYEVGCASIFFINSTNAHSPDANFARLPKIEKNGFDPDTERSAVAVTGTVTLSFTDFSLLINGFVGTWFQLSGSSDPLLVHEVINKLVLGFIGRQFNHAFQNNLEDALKIHGNLLQS